MVKKSRRIAFVLIVAALGLAVWYALRPREPVYQGRKLSLWLDDLVQGPSNHESSEEAGYQAYLNRAAKAEEAIRQIGPDAIPYLLKLLRDRPGPAPIRDKIESLLAQQSILDIHLPRPRDRSWLAVEGLATLGPKAAAAIPELGRMLESEETCTEAAYVFAAIGPAAIPRVAHAITNGTPGTRSVALLTLGDFGRSANHLTPMILSLIQKGDRSMADVALRVLSEINEAPEDLLPLYAGCLGDAKTAPGAAFALARLGDPGLPVLLPALTNKQKEIRGAALVALQPMDSKRGLYWTTNPPAYRFSVLSHLFNTKFRLATMDKNSRVETFAMVSALTCAQDSKSEEVRALAVELLATLGADAAVGLCRALEDSSETIRKDAAAAIGRLDAEVSHGGIVRGPKHVKKLALVFSAHEFAEGGEMILNELSCHQVKASFFLTGDFMVSTNFASIIGRIIRDDHLLGPHSDKHLLYCSWEAERKPLLTREQFGRDLALNNDKIRLAVASEASPGIAAERREFLKRYGVPGSVPVVTHVVPYELRYFLPPYEHYNIQIADWTKQMGLTLINFTPGTRSNADYTGEADANFVSSQAIFDSIVKREQEDPHGLNGFILLFHLGSGPGRQDKFHHRFGELLDYLAAKGYQFVRVDELLEPKPEDAQ